MFRVNDRTVLEVGNNILPRAQHVEITLQRERREAE